ncbi:GAF domain-containing protein [Polaromonas sp. P2-4]|nr:GAF domain-containing protein [Polaromonas sp. P2-4]
MNLTDRRYFQDALHSGNPLAVEPVFGRLTGSAVLQVAYAARNEDGEPAFVLLASLDLEKFMQAHAKSLPRETAVIALTDGQGTILTWHPGGEKLRGTSIVDSPLFRFAHDHQGADAREFTELGGTSRIWAASVLPEFAQAGLHVLVGVSKKELLAAANQTLVQALSILAMVSLLAFTGAWVLVELGIRRPVARIIAAVARFSGGGFGARIGKPYPGGEIGGLMVALDRSFDLTQTVHRRVVRGAEVLERANRALNMLSQSNKALVQSLDEDALLRDLCRIVVKFGGYRRCWLGYAEQDAAKSIRPVVQAGYADGYLETLHLTWADQAGGRGPVGSAIRSGAPVQEQNLPDDPEARRERAAEAGDAALIALPIRSNGEVLGALVIYAAESDRFDDQEVSLLVELAADLGYGIYALRNRAELDRHRFRLEELVKQRTIELANTNREVESFSYSVSHDLRAPLRHVQGYAELLREDAGSTLSAEARRYLQVIAGAGQEMGELIDDLLSFLRMNRAGMREVSVDLDALVREAIDHLKTDTEGRHIAWQLAPLPRVVADAAMLRQVLANLLGNAVKYTGPRAAEIEIGSAGEENGRVIVFVRDNGVGFDMQYADKLFSVFQRLHHADEFKGRGIGLANVRRIIARHGGRVWAESRPGAGATIYFTLRPAQPAHPP